MRSGRSCLPPPAYPTAMKPSSSGGPRRKSRWDATDPKPKPKPNPSPNPTPAAPPPTLSTPRFPLPGPSLPPPLAYGFHNLERRTILLADGTLRSYFALPPDDRPPVAPPAPALDRGWAEHGRAGFHPVVSPPEAYLRGGYVRHDYWASRGLLDGRVAVPEEEVSHKRKLEEDDARARGQADDVLLQNNQHQILHYDGYGRNPDPDGRRRSSDRLEYAGHRAADGHRRREDGDGRRPLKYLRGNGEINGNDNLHSRRGVVGGDSYASKRQHFDVDPAALKKAFLAFSKLVNESASQKKKYLEGGRHGPLPCLVCDRDFKSKDYADAHGLIMHAYNSSVERTDHLGFHKALCVLMGWNYWKAPDDSKLYQSLPADEQAANRDDLIIWPPLVIVHNTILGKRNDGRMDGMGNKDMDAKIRDLGFGGGKSKSMYGKDGHLGITIVKFSNYISGLTEAEGLAEYFERNHHGRKGWDRAQASKKSGEDDEKNPLLLKVDDRTRNKRRILYGYLGTALDLDKVDFEFRKKAVIKSRKELDISA